MTTELSDIKREAKSSCDPTTNFTQLVDLASAKLGGKALAASDEFFAAKENLLKPGQALFLEGKFTSRGKWMDGWETRRRRGLGHDWCVIRLGFRGILRGMDVDTSHFTGNHPESCSLEACNLSPENAWAKAEWVEILPQSGLKGDCKNLFPLQDSRPWTHIRLNIYPDGGVARLRAYGEVVPDREKLKNSKKVDLAALENGGSVLSASDMHFSSKNNLILPGRAKNMGEGWETRRRRGPGFDWALIRLAALGHIERIEVDTRYFKGNYPESCSIEGCRLDNPSMPEAWQEVLPRTKLKGHARHVFSQTLSDRGPFTHIRFNIYPDGGISRLRIYGKLAGT